MVRGDFGEFHGFGFGYWQRHPSTSYTLHHLGNLFVEYLRDTRPDEDGAAGSTGDWPAFLIELARLEWAIYEVFDGPGLEKGTPPNLSDLLSTSSADWLSLRLQCAPCLRLLEVEYPVNDHYTLVRQSEGEFETDLPQPRRQWLAISR